MKYLYHEFNFKERLAIILVLISLFAVFYTFVIKGPLDSATSAATMQKESLQTELSIVNTKINRYEKMKEELDQSNASYMPSYNASKAEVTFLDSIFSSSKEYGIKFTNLSREGNLVRRSFYFNFTTNSNAQAQKILKSLINCEYRCLVTDISSFETKGEIVVSGNATFYETLVDGSPDAALPPDTSEVQ